jgi:pre-mRNA-processing factor 6
LIEASASLSFAESITKALDSVELHDVEKMEPPQFETFVHDFVASMDASVGDFAEFVVYQVLWWRVVYYYWERHHGSAESLDDVLKAASERLPRVELFCLLRAKERWVAKDIDIAQEILTAAFAANPDSESVWLAAAKLENAPASCCNVHENERRRNGCL